MFRENLVITGHFGVHLPDGKRVKLCKLKNVMIRYEIWTKDFKDLKMVLSVNQTGDAFRA